MAYQPPPKRYDPAGTPGNNSVELSGLIGDLCNLSIAGASGFHEWTTPARPIQPAPVMNRYHPSSNRNFVNGPGNLLPIGSTNRQLEYGHQPGFNRNFGNFVDGPGNLLPIGSTNHQLENGHQPGSNRNFVSGPGNLLPIVPTNNQFENGHQPGSNRNFGNFVNGPGNLLPIASTNSQFANGHHQGSNRNFNNVPRIQHLIGGNGNANGHQLGFNPDSVTVQDNQLPIVSNKMQFENGHQPGFNSNSVNVQHLIGGNSNTNGYGGGDRSYIGPKKAEAARKFLSQASKLVPKNHSCQNQFSKGGSDSKNTFLFPHLPSSLLRESCTDDTVLIPYQMSAAKFLLCTAPHMFEIGIGNVIDMVDQWDNPAPQLTGTSQSGDSIWLNNSKTGGM